LSPWRFRNADNKEIQTVADAPRLLVSSPDAAADAAVNGVGATLLLEHDVAEAVSAGKLRFILQKFEVDPLPVHLVHPSRDMPVKLRRFIDFAVPRLREALSDFGRSTTLPR
jgi:DNA-binding transcriptional LysR family regulator